MMAVLDTAVLADLAKDANWLDSYGRDCMEEGDGDASQIGERLEAIAARIRRALSATGEPAGVRALEWDGNHADSIVGPYSIVKYHSRYGLIGPNDPFDGFGYRFEGPLEKCREAAQSHFDAAIRSALAPVTVGGDLVERLAEMLDDHHGRHIPMGVDAASFGRGAQAGWDAAVSECIKRVQPSAAAALAGTASLPAPKPAIDAGASLDERMKAAGMIPLSKLLAGDTPLAKWEAHTGVRDLKTFEEWLQMRHREFMRMRVAYDLGDKDKTDDLYEWVFAHAGALSEVVANFRAALLQAPEGAAAEERPDWMERTIDRVGKWLADYDNNASHDYEEGDPTDDNLAEFDRDDIRTLLLAASSPAPSALTAALLAAAGWRTMDSAPKDGTAVILAVPHYESGWIIGEAYFDPEHPNDGGDWWWAGTSDGDYHSSSLLEGNHNRPTHWMPLPAVPETEQRNG